LESGVALISATAIVNTYAGLILAGSLLIEGLITTKSVLIALLLGTVVSIVLGKICETFFALARVAFWTTVRREGGCDKRRNNACHRRAAHRGIIDNLAQSREY